MVNGFVVPIPRLPLLLKTANSDELAKLLNLTPPVAEPDLITVALSPSPVIRGLKVPDVSESWKPPEGALPP